MKASTYIMELQLLLAKAFTMINWDVFHKAY